MDEGDLLSQLAGDLANAATVIADDFASGEVVDEDDFNSQLVRAIKGSVKTFAQDHRQELDLISILEDESGPPRPAVRIHARRLTDKGPGSEETEAGADIVIVLDIETQHRKVQKGILIQAKILNKNGEIKNSTERGRLLQQCDHMLDRTSSAFVFGYQPGNISTWSAAMVEAAGGASLQKLRTWDLEMFFYDFLICWTGDPRLSAIDRDTLLALRTLVQAKNAILIMGSVR